MNLARLIIQIGLPFLFVAFIALELLILPLIEKGHRTVRRNAAKGFILLTTAMFLFTLPEILLEPIVYRIGGVFDYGVFFRVDLLNFPLLMLSGLLFLVIGFYSREDIHYLFYTVTYIATIGTLLAGDLLTFFLFFEIMTFSSYALMVYHRGDEQLEAGFVYIYMGIIGGLMILSGILLLSAYTGTFQWTNLAVRFSELGMIKYLIGFFFVAGFGIKAGMVPFHFWIPRIYDGAPIAVAALSSGVLIKVGAYGILKVVSVIFSVDISRGLQFYPMLWRVSEHIGFVIIWMGILTMIVGVFMALQQGSTKKMLAYHSVSQMGYVIMGIGVAGYLGYIGPMGFVGSLYHMLNHSLFKVLLFMVAGAVFYQTGETNMYNMGGLWRKMPVTALLCFIAVLGITGMPGFNGYASKTMLHHAIDEAFKYGHPSFEYAEWAFKVVSAGTVCSFIKFFYFIFLRRQPEGFGEEARDSKRMAVSMAVLAVFIVFIGLFPNWLPEQILIPAAMAFSYDAGFIGNYLTNMNFWTVKDLTGMVVIYALGFAMFLVGHRFHLFHLKLPAWMNAEKFIYTPVTTVCEKFPEFCVTRYEKPIIFGDTLIYALILCVIMGALVISRLVF
ncbi:complex I subunit 5 family protein [Anoxynatronum buryatiense]|uniref:Formate hydrogenlyase subunit 3/Multisubunit Na+/H+ antiporter, MnhD subunit n=1 Tax=Anoxynatronum buryatiense TaxID=489973 RepID=A0AA45WU20_9CLOT|nr:complex I subunit 5 family protein [Anoxynatronum buryatiense]SMP45151.1 Formate hydrogenlyase subunit 3/Multisubunit Na+/H+ antiporter, MnhD subunit [Anoxynatronum buryatiense]